MRTVILLLSCLVTACGASSGQAAEQSGPAPAALIPDVPECPPPPGWMTSASARAWVERVIRVGRIAESHMIRAVDQVERRRDVPGLACLEPKQRAVSGLRRRIGAEKLALSSASGERAVARVRMHCLRIQRLVMDARECR